MSLGNMFGTEVWNGKQVVLEMNKGNWGDYFAKAPSEENKVHKTYKKKLRYQIKADNLARNTSNMTFGSYSCSLPVCVLSF